MSFNKKPEGTGNPKKTKTRAKRKAPLVFVETYGCTANRVDTQIMRALLEKAGFKTTIDPELEASSDLILLNSCTVKDKTHNHVVKRAKNCGKPLVIAGCLAASNPHDLPPHASLVAPSRIEMVVEAAEAALNGKNRKVFLDENVDGKPYVPDKACLPVKFWEGVSAAVSISEGCVGSCSYCATRLARGKLVSFSIEGIAKTARLHIESGCREVWLTSQDLGAYGMDLDACNKSKLPQLLGEIIHHCKDLPEFRMRLGMMNPNHFIADADLLLRVLEKVENASFFKFFHIPVQSGSDRVLKNMGRTYSSKDFLNVVKRIRERFPAATIATDIIVGFPGESEADFEKSMSLLRRVKPGVLNISKYSPRPNTPAAGMPQVLQRTVKERSRSMTRLHHEQNKKMLESRFVGRTVRIIVDAENKKGRSGRTDEYVTVALSGEGKKNAVLGEFMKVRIDSCTHHYLLGRIVD